MDIVGFMVIAVIIVIFALMCWAALQLRKFWAYRAQQDRKRLIEAQVRQDIIDAHSYQQAAQKILREQGQTQ